MSEKARFWSKVNKTESCWLWTASLTNTYGAFRLSKENGSKLVRANRYSYELQYGPIPKGLLVCHKCDNRLCVKPIHLFLGTHKQNTRDMVSKNRQYKPKLTKDQVQEIRFIYQGKAMTQKELANAFGVSQGMIHFIVSGKQWIGAE